MPHPFRVDNAMKWMQNAAMGKSKHAERYWTIRIQAPPKIKDKIYAIAEAERRSVAATIGVLLEDAIEEWYARE